MKATVRVAVEVDLEKAQQRGQVLQAVDFLRRLQHQGEDWQREVKADPLLSQFLTVEVWSAKA